MSKRKYQDDLAKLQKKRAKIDKKISMLRDEYNLSELITMVKESAPESDDSFDCTDDFNGKPCEGIKCDCVFPFCEWIAIVGGWITKDKKVKRIRGRRPSAQALLDNNFELVEATQKIRVHTFKDDELELPVWLFEESEDASILYSPESETLNPENEEMYRDSRVKVDLLDRQLSKAKKAIWTKYICDIEPDHDGGDCLRGIVTAQVLFIRLIPPEKLIQRRSTRL